MSIGSVSSIAGFGYVPKFRAVAADVGVQRPDAANVRRVDSRRDDVRDVETRRRDDIRSGAVTPDAGVSRGKMIDLIA
jgi:hypothetical protein